MSDDRAAADGTAAGPTTVEITGIAKGGEGVGRLPDGRVVFVHRTAPGETVDVRVLEEKKSWARGEAIRVREASAARRDAPCPHYERCGGCTLEHLRYPAQLEAKRGIVVDALERIGGFDVSRPAVTPSPDEFRYRNRLSFTLLRIGGGRVVAGFHELNRPKRVVGITEDCLLPEPALAAVWGRIRAEWGQNARRLPSGRRLRLTVRVSVEGEAALLIDGGYGSGMPDELLDAVPGLVSIWHRRAKQPKFRRVAGRDAVEEMWHGETIALRGDMFLQVNRGAASALEAHVLEVAGDVSGVKVVDAYCGVGLHARRLARRGATVVGIERDGRAVEEARRTASDDASFVVGDVEDRLPDALPADLVIVNPPRTGLDEAVPTALAARPPARMIYVSCDAATLARDLKRLGAGFEIASIRCFDLFPQTAQVETVVELRCVTS